MAVVNDLGNNNPARNLPGEVPQFVPPETPQAQESKPKSKKGYIIGFFVTLLLIAGVGVGVYLIQNQQIFKSKASAAQCYSTDTTNGCTFAQNPDHCWRATTNNGCLVNGQPEGTLEVFSGPGNYDGQVCYTCPDNSDEPGVVKCTSGGNVQINSSCGGNATTQPTASPTPRPAVCGESCQRDSDCAPSTHPAVGSVVCRQGQCVNQECYETGGKTVFGTQCLCEAAGKCGSECGAGIGLCDAGFSCTYPGQTQCNPAKKGICVPNGTNAGRGPMEGVPIYDGAYFERKQCGAGTADANNNYIYHPSFPNHVFTTGEVLSLICNPAPSPSPTATPIPTPTATPGTDINAQCLIVNAYDLDWNMLTNAQLSQLQPGDTIRFGVLGYASDNGIIQARFTINGQPQSPTSQKRVNTEEYYLDYTIPQPASGETKIDISVQAELYHTGLGQWF